MSNPVLPDTIATQLAEMDRRLRALEGAPQLVSSSIKEGALSVLNASGASQVVLGKLPDGNYGLGQYDPSGGGTWVNLSTLAYGIAATSDTRTLSTASTSYVDLPSAFAATVTTTIGASGRALILAFCYLAPANGFANNVRLDRDSGAATLADPIMTLTTVTGAQDAASCSGAFLASGLTAGSHSFRLQFKVSGGTGAFGPCTILALPF